MKFRENPSSRNRVALCGERDGHNEAKPPFAILRMRLKLESQIEEPVSFLLSSFCTLKTAFILVFSVSYTRPTMKFNKGHCIVLY